MVGEDWDPAARLVELESLLDVVVARPRWNVVIGDVGGRRVGLANVCWAPMAAMSPTNSTRWGRSRSSWWAIAGASIGGSLRDCAHRQERDRRRWRLACARRRHRVERRPRARHAGDRVVRTPRPIARDWMSASASCSTSSSTSTRTPPSSLASRSATPRTAPPLSRRSTAVSPRRARRHSLSLDKSTLESHA